MAIKCSMGSCGISCSTDGCECSSSWHNPDDCVCNCIQSQPAFSPTNRVKKISILRYKRRIKANPQSRYNICFRNVPITTLALSFDEVLPNRILIPTNKLTKKVNLSLKNKTFRQIVIASGLAIKS
ncbi:MAG TPA: hypothetical protein VNA18_01830 [Nitrososphaeraceae archaeon]|nr:hypothetical protein [Nitrososphaeraceae archaeon]